MKRIILLSVILVLANADDLTSVETKQGVINGKVVGHSFRGQDYTTQRFLGIPYATPPTGQLRFEKPEPYGTFTEPCWAPFRFFNNNIFPYRIPTFFLTYNSFPGE